MIALAQQFIGGKTPLKNIASSSSKTGYFTLKEPFFRGLPNLSSLQK
jgi:hypothetical protein